MEDKIKELEGRIKELEFAVFSDEPETSSAGKDYEISEIISVENFIDREVLSLEPTAVELRLSGNPTAGTTDWPDSRGYCKYSGTAWLQNGVGEIFTWYYIESCAEKNSIIEYPQGKPNGQGYNEVRNTHTARMGWGGRWFGGRCRIVGCWARFLDQNGNGYRVKWQFGG